MRKNLDVLIVEDDPTLRDVLRFHFETEGWDVRTAHTGPAALDAARVRAPEVVVLDVMLPGLSGIDVCATLRRTYDPSPGVVMVTARDDEVDVILGLEVGADDYVVKPCRPREIVARVKAVARRLARDAPSSPPSADTSVLAFEHVSIDLRRRAVHVGANAVRLTPSEFALLTFLARNPERVYTRLELLRHVFDSTAPGYARNVDCHVARLRRKLEAAGATPAPVRTAHGTGYFFAVSGAAC